MTWIIQGSWLVTIVMALWDTSLRGNPNLYTLSIQSLNQPVISRLQGNLLIACRLVEGLHRPIALAPACSCKISACYDL